ncbi:MAG: aminomethyl-transferring glycine dehydrogenase subunit GcvPA [bacterium]|nr:aminomethyl-transferring glycine dehydrogenase subunit GcvPA [bacterium]
MYIPTKQEVLLNKINDLSGIKFNNVDELFKEITGKEKFYKPNLLKPLSQIEIIDYFENILKSISLNKYFVGLGAYDHFIPPIVDELIRSEFLTSYTPYQAEISQGTLQIIWEFQSLISDLFNMDVCNSSHYDGATALAESLLMAYRIYPNKNAYKYIIPNSIHPHYFNVLKTYCYPFNFSPVFLEFDKDGKIDLNKLEELSKDDSIFSVVIQSPNLFGIIENINVIKNIIKEKILILLVLEPLAYFILPKIENVDIVSANLQSFGIPLSFGGPYLGVIATKKEYIRQLPGRIIGKTIDKDNNTAFTMILQTREQHIKREKANSNICTNQGLMAIRNTIYLLSLGKNNLIKIAKLNNLLINYLSQELINSNSNIKLLFNDINSKVFNEIAIYFPEYNEFHKKLLNQNIFFGSNLAKLHFDNIHLQNIFNNFKSLHLNYTNFNDFINNTAIICTTEKNSLNDLEYIINLIKESK